MDDTTLVSKTPEGLRKISTAFVNFCGKFRSKLNEGKSKLVRFRNAGKDEDMALVAGGKTFTTPKPDKKG